MRKRLSKATRLVLSLDPVVDVSEGKRQLRRSLTRGLDPGRVELGRLAALAYGAQVVSLVWYRGDTAFVAVYDRSKDRVLSRVSVVGSPPQNAQTALRAALREWQGATRDKPLYKRPIFYLTEAGVAAVTGVVMYFVLRSDEPQRDIVFR